MYNDILWCVFHLIRWGCIKVCGKREGEVYSPILLSIHFWIMLLKIIILLDFDRSLVKFSYFTFFVDNVIDNNNIARF